MSSPKKILIVDDEPIARLGLASLIVKEPGLILCGEATGTAEGTLRVRELQPDLVILDIAVQGDRGLDFIQFCRSVCPVLIFSMREETLYAERCLMAGARGYVGKREPLEAIRRGIFEVLRGGIFLGERVRERIHHRMLRDPASVSREDISALTNRELEVFELTGQGATSQETAERLKVNLKTVQGYHISIRQRLRLSNHNQLIRRAVHYVLEGQ